MRAYLCQVDGWNGGTATAVKTASHDDDRLCHLNGAQWWPAIARLPTLRYDMFDGSFEGSIVAPTGEMQLQLDAIPSLPALALHGARVRIWHGELGDPWANFTALFDGRVNEQPAVANGAATLTIGVDDSWLDAPLLGTYAGTGNAEGQTELKGNVKPLLLGAPRFVEGVLVDTPNSIYQVSAGQIEDIELAFDKLNRFGTPVADYSTFAALKAATIAPGKWATSLATGFARLGAPPDGVVTFHVRGDKAGSRGWVRRAGSIIHRIAEICGALAKVNVASLDALDAACPWNLSIDIGAQTTARDVILSVAQSVNAVPVIDWLGILYLLPVGIGTSQATLAADGSSLPPIASVEQLAIAAPWWRMAQKAAVTQRVHNQNEIAFDVTPYERGNYDAAVTYREGDIVTISDGSRWKFVGSPPLAGSTPSDANANWDRQTDATAEAVPLGTNVIINSEMTQMTPGGSTYPLGFVAGWQGDSSNLGGLSFSDGRVQLADGTYGFGRTQTGGTPNGTAMDIVLNNYTDPRRWLIPVLPGDHLMGSVLGGTQHAQGYYAEAQFLDENGAYVFEIGGASVAHDIGSVAFTSLTRGDLALASFDCVVPADGYAPMSGTKRCRWAYLNVRMMLNGQANVRGVAAAPMMTKVPAGQVALPLYLPGPGDRSATLGGDWNTNVTNIPYAAITNTDAASALGFNGSFEEWTGTYPAGWSLWSGNGTPPSKNNSITRVGSNSVKIIGTGLSDESGLERLASWATNPMPAGTIVAGNYDVYLENVTSGKPTMLVRLFTNSSLTTFRDTFVQPPSNAANAWQTVNWIARVNAGERIYGIQLFIMGSYNAIGLPYTGTAYWDRIEFSFLGSSIDNQQINLNADGSATGGPTGQITIVGLGYLGSLLATRNDIYTGATDPGGANGSMWKDTSTTPAKFRLKIGGSWIDVSSLVTDTGQLTDGANLGLTALWSGVAGTGKPEDYADVASDIVGPTDISINADYAGTVTDTMPRTEQYALQRLGSNVAASASWSVSVISGTISATIGASTGLLSLNTSGGALTNTKLEISAAYSGQTRKFTVKVTRKDANPPASGSGGATVNDGGFTGSTTSTTLVPIGNELNVGCGASGTATLRASYEFTTGASSGSQGLQMQWGRWNGASYTMLGSPVAQTDLFVPGSGSPGAGNCDYNDSGLGAYALVKYQLFAKNNSGTIQRDITGNESVVGG